MKRLFALFLLSTLFAFPTGCSRGEREPTATPAPSVSATEEPVEVTELTVGLWNLGEAVQGSQSYDLKNYIESRFGLSIIPWAMTEADYGEKIVAAASSGALPDLFAHGIFEDRMRFKQLVDQTLIREIPEDIYKNYHYLGTMMYRYASTESVDGKMYFLPRADMCARYNNGQSTAIFFRLDWALESGAFQAGQTPSWQNFMDLMGYYAHGDPDRNGEEDTRGLTSAGTGLGGLETAFYMTFGVRDWVLENGKWIPGLLSLKAREATQWASQAYRSGLIDPQYNAQSEPEAFEKFCSGQVGMLVADASPAGSARLNAAWIAKQPGTDIRQAVSVLAQPLSPWGVAYNEDASYHTGTCVSAAVDDKKLTKALKLMDWLYSPEGLTFLNWGEQGKDYNVTGSGLQTLHRGTDGLPVQYIGLIPEWAGLTALSTWGKDYIEDDRAEDYRRKYLTILNDAWWTNNWRRPMFTRTILDESVQSFNADGRAEAALAALVAGSADIGADWDAYVSRMNTELNVQAAAQVVNDYASAHGITTEE